MRARDPFLFLLGAASACVAISLWPSGGSGSFESGRSALENDLGAAAPEQGALTELPPTSEGEPSGRTEVSHEGAPNADPSASVDAAAAAIDAVSQPLPRAIPSDEELEQRFGDLDLAQLEGARLAIGWVLDAEARRLLDEKFAAGQYSAEVVPAGYEIQGARATAAGGLVSERTQWIPLENAMFEVRQAQVHPSESFELQVRSAEFRWLCSRVAKLKKQEKERKEREEGD